MMFDPATLTMIGTISSTAGGLGGMFGRTAGDMQFYNEQMARRNQRMVNERLSQIMGLYGRRGEFFSDQMAIVNPQLAFADTQSRQAASAGARAAQANLRRSLGSAGDLFSAALETGARTAATDQQNTLRALATAEALKAADREIQGRSGVLASLPFAMFQGAVAGPNRWDLFKEFGTNLGTGLGGIAEMNPRGGSGSGAANVLGTNGAAINTLPTPEQTPAWGATSLDWGLFGALAA